MLADGSPKSRRQLDREHRRRLRHIDAPSLRRALRITAGLPLRAAEPARQLPGGFSHRNTSRCQVSSSVDPLGILTSTNPVTSHAINVLPGMSQPRRNTPRPFQPPVAQRDIKAEVAHCVGGVVSPLLANVYLHYVLDWWARTWRNRHARGDMIIVRWADDFVVGFEHLGDAKQFLRDLRERFAKFSLELNADKTRLIQFGGSPPRIGRSVGSASRTRSTSWASRTSAGRAGADSSGCSASRSRNGCGPSFTRSMTNSSDVGIYLSPNRANGWQACCVVITPTTPCQATSERSQRSGLRSPGTG
jgi:hypothetical protein